MATQESLAGYVPAGMKIRQLTPTDAAIYQELRLFGLQESPTAFGSSYEDEAKRPLTTVSERLADPLNHTFGAFSEDGRLVGVALLRRSEHEKTAHKASVYAVYVHPEYRRRGVGQGLMERIIARARQLGVRQLILTVVTANPAPVRLYEQCGFEHFGLEKEAFSVGGTFYDAAYMRLRLAPRAEV